MLGKEGLSEPQLLQFSPDLPLKFRLVEDVWRALPGSQLDVVDALFTFCVFNVQLLVVLVHFSF